MVVCYQSHSELFSLTHMDFRCKQSLIKNPITWPLLLSSQKLYFKSARVYKMFWFNIVIFIFERRLFRSFKATHTRTKIKIDMILPCMDKNSIFINLFIEMFLNLAFGLDENSN